MSRREGPEFEMKKTSAWAERERKQGRNRKFNEMKTVQLTRWTAMVMSTRCDGPFAGGRGQWGRIHVCSSLRQACRRSTTGPSVSELRQPAKSCDKWNVINPFHIEHNSKRHRSTCLNLFYSSHSHSYPSACTRIYVRVCVLPLVVDRISLKLNQFGAVCQSEGRGTVTTTTMATESNQMKKLYRINRV